MSRRLLIGTGGGAGAVVGLDPKTQGHTGGFEFQDAQTDVNEVHTWPNTGSAGSAGDLIRLISSAGPAKLSDRLQGDGADQLVGGSASLYWSLGAGSGLVRVSYQSSFSFSTWQAPVAPIRLRWATGDGTQIAFSITDSGGVKTITTAVSVGVFFTLQYRWNSTVLETRVDGGAWSSIAAGAVVGLVGALETFRNDPIDYSHQYMFNVAKSRVDLEQMYDWLVNEVA